MRSPVRLSSPAKLLSSPFRRLSGGRNSFGSRNSGRSRSPWSGFRAGRSPARKRSLYEGKVVRMPDGKGPILVNNNVARPFFDSAELTEQSEELANLFDNDMFALLGRTAADAPAPFMKSKKRKAAAAAAAAAAAVEEEEAPSLLLTTPSLAHQHEADVDNDDDGAEADLHEHFARPAATPCFERPDATPMRKKKGSSQRPGGRPALRPRTPGASQSGSPMRKQQRRRSAGGGGGGGAAAADGEVAAEREQLLLSIVAGDVRGDEQENAGVGVVDVQIVKSEKSRAGMFALERARQEKQEEALRV